jgi:hypothetical protein
LQSRVPALRYPELWILGLKYGEPRRLKVDENGALDLPASAWVLVAPDELDGVSWFQELTLQGLEEPLDGGRHADQRPSPLDGYLEI